MAGPIDDETETAAARAVFSTRNEIAARILLAGAIAANRRDDFGEARFVVAKYRRHDDPVGTMAPVERPAVFFDRQARIEHLVVDMLPGVRLVVPKCLVGGGLLQIGEQIGERLGDSGSAAILLIEPIRRAQQRMNLLIARRIEMKSTMTRG